MLRFLRAAWQGWKRIAESIGHFQARVLWTLMYFVVVGPFAVAMKMFSDPLRLKQRSLPSWWLENPRQTSNLQEAQRQF